MAVIANYPVNWDGSANDNGAIGVLQDQLGETFQVNAGGPYSPTSVDIPVSASNPLFTPGTVTLDIYAVDGSGFPTGDSLSTGSFDGSGLSVLSPPKSFSAVDVNVAMSAASLTSGTTYILVMSISSGWVKWYATNTAGYPSGSPKNRITATGLWEDATNVGDFGFRIFGDGVAPNKPTNPTPANGAASQRLNLASFLWEAG